ncbi:multidrug efflux pump subunit AcrB [Paraburkholderia sp. HC6.4b]|nr:multidrug efflux pump subunit AcrB [Paraburkholderia sp. HC6.4b]MBB5455569.1 multidrug efflux pump subunit AcrB [Paraburkholderia sp. Kb1A]
MNFGQWMQTHRRSLLFVIALLAIAGALSAFRLPISLFPNVAFPRAVVSLEAGDRPAEQMTTLVTMPVEEALRRVPNVRDVESRTSRGAAEISLNFDWGTDMAQATLQAQSAISEILATLPPGTTCMCGAWTRPCFRCSRTASRRRGSRYRRCTISRSSRCGRCCRRWKASRASR